MSEQWKVGQLLEVVLPSDMRWYGTVFRVKHAPLRDSHISGVVIKLGPQSTLVTRVGAEVEFARHKLRLVRGGFGKWVKEHDYAH